jgi:hypothetical protein
MRRMLIAGLYVLIVIAGAGLFAEFFENSAHPHTLIALTGGFLFLVGVYMLWIEFVGPKRA